jgi:hypothetical protein
MAAVLIAQLNGIDLGKTSAIIRELEALKGGPTSDLIVLRHAHVAPLQVIARRP